MEYLQAVERDIGKLFQHSFDEVQQAEEASGLNNCFVGLVKKLRGDYAIYAAHAPENAIDPTRVAIDAEGVITYRSGDKINVTVKFPTNTYEFVNSCGKAAKVKFACVPHDTDNGLRVFPITTCSSSTIFHNPDTHTFYEDEELSMFEGGQNLLKPLMQQSLTEAIFKAVQQEVKDTSFRVIGSHFNLNRFGRIDKKGTKRGLPRDSFTDDILDSTIPFDIGKFRGVNDGFFTQITRIVRNIIPSNDPAQPPKLRVSQTLLLAVMAFHLGLHSAIEPSKEARKRIERGCGTEVDHILSKGKIAIFQTEKLALGIDEDLKPDIWLGGVDESIRKLLHDILTPAEVNECIESNNPNVRTTDDLFSFTFKSDCGFEEELENANMKSAILWAKHGEAARARAHLCVEAVRTCKSKVAAHILASSVEDLPESLDMLIEDVLELEGEGIDDTGHYARSRDRSHSISGRTRVAHMTVKPRGMRETGVMPSKKKTLMPEKKGYKMTVEIEDNFETGRMRRIIVGRLQTPLRAALTAIEDITGINVMGVGFTRVGGRRKYIIHQNEVAYSLLQGHYGWEGFDWIMGALLSNKVHVDKSSDAIGYLPTWKMEYAEGGVLINEPLSGLAVQYLNCVTDDSKVLIDWGEQLGAVQLKRGYKVLVTGKRITRDFHDRVWKRCQLSLRFQLC